MSRNPFEDTKYEGDTLSQKEIERRKYKNKKKLNSFKLKKLIERDGNRCCYCTKIVVINVPEHAHNRATVEHCLPKSFGGTNKLSNLKVACRQCNNKRGNKLI